MSISKVSSGNIILFSGGLDSILAVKVLQEQEIKLLGICFKSYFFDAKQAKKSAKAINLPLKVIDFSKQHLEIVKNPKYGYGKAINPCIDCHSLMLKIAKQKFAKQIENNDIKFIAVGDVLNQRPMSQNKQALEMIEKNAGLKAFVLRPLSAKLLEPTNAEQKKIINRKKLLSIQGKSRKEQIILAEKYKIKQYPSPSGGCILTDKEFAKRLKILFEIYPKFGYNDIELLKLGRHFLLKKQKIKIMRKNGEFFPNIFYFVKIIVGRNEKENKKIEKLAMPSDTLIEMKNYTGPITLIRNYGKAEITKLAIKKAQKLTQFYSLKARSKKDIKF